MNHDSPSAETLRNLFDAVREYTLGIEEELMLLDPVSLELVPRGPEALKRLGGDERFKLELPASQIEILTDPVTRAGDAAAALLEARHVLSERIDGLALPAGAGVSPLGSGVGELNEHPRYERTRREYGPVAGRQLVCALQIHVAVPGADRALAVYNAARTYLPWLAALAANGAFYEGADTGLASMRPTLSQLLPRQGIPPALPSWDHYADALGWGADTAAFPDPGAWWWELRPHRRLGTLEFRVPDAQSTVADAAAIAAVIQALVVWLGDRGDAGELGPPSESWRLEENRWSACRYGVEGWLVDPDVGGRRPTRDCLNELLDHLAPVAARLNSENELARARELVEVNGAIAQRRAAAGGQDSASGAERGEPNPPAEHARAVARWLTERFLEPLGG